jgi:hypothetical protein
MVIFFLPQVAFSQDDHGILFAFGELSRPEKWWAIRHIFIAKKTFGLSKQALIAVDQLKKKGTLDGDDAGGQLDAFKHAYWMALLAQEINPKKALKLGMAHEKGNYLSFKKAAKAGQYNSHDAVASDMDLYNNQKGIEIGLQFPDVSKEDLMNIVIDVVLAGEMLVIRKNSKGEFLDEHDRVIPKDSLIGKWETAKVLVKSDYR